MDSATVEGDRANSITPLLLGCGVVAGPLYLAVGLAQALTREGFDLARHPLSILANGPGGWIQVANLAITGLMVIAASVGIGRTVPKSRVATWALAVFGLGMVVSAIFRADPMDGFPPGTPEGIPTAISSSGLMHFAAGGVSFLALAISGLAMAWTMRRRGASGLALLSLVSGLTVLVGFFGGMALQLGVWGIWAAVVMGWIWLSGLSFTLRRQA